jgi:hypothetical protein
MHDIGMNNSPEPAAYIPWRTSTYSAYNGNCVQVADLDVNRIGVRDSKNPDGPVLTFAANDWQTFVDGLKSSPVGT